MSKKYQIKETDNNWVKHIKQYANEHNMTYMCALSEAKTTYKKKSKDDDLKTLKKWFSIDKKGSIKDRVFIRDLWIKIAKYDFDIKIDTTSSFKMKMYDVYEKDELNNWKKEFNKLLNEVKNHTERKQFYKQLINIGKKEIPKEFKESRQRNPDRKHKHKYFKDMFF